MLSARQWRSRWIFALLAASLLTACASRPPASSMTAAEAGTDALQQTLERRFLQWRGVRYRWGGLSKAGVDCSGFVYLTFRDLFGIVLPRTAYRQSTAGHTIEQRHLQAGDLVFFRIGRRQYHVGIYYRNRRFLHVSSHKGVIISSLDNRYWSPRYWKAVHIPLKAPVATGHDPSPTLPPADKKSDAEAEAAADLRTSSAATASIP